MNSIFHNLVQTDCILEIDEERNLKFLYIRILNQTVKGVLIIKQI